MTTEIIYPEEPFQTMRKVAGTVRLNLGSATVTFGTGVLKVTATSRFLIARQGTTGAAAGYLQYDLNVAGNQLKIQSSNGADSGNVTYVYVGEYS